MTPDFRIIADATDITAALRDRLLSLSVSDAAGIESDTLEISLDDRDGVIALPRTGAELTVELGYKNAGLQRMGIYTVDEVGLSGPPQQMTIRARAADLRQGLKKPRTRSWDEVWLADIVRSIAAEHGDEARVGQVFESEALVHIDQADESDLHFLTRLARERGAVAKPAGGLLLFVPAGEAKSASGRTIAPVTLGAGAVSRWEVTLAERGKYPAVTARWFDTASAAERTVTAGSGEPVFTIGRRYPDEQSAASAARAKLAAFARGLATLRLSCPGDPLLIAEGRMTVAGLRSGADGDWIITRVTHRLDGGGYVCDIEAETPKESA